MLYTNQLQPTTNNEYQDIELRIGQQVEFIDDSDNYQWGQVLRVDEGMDMVRIVHGHIVQQVSWVHADNITSA